MICNVLSLLLPVITAFYFSCFFDSFRYCGHNNCHRKLATVLISGALCIVVETTYDIISMNISSAAFPHVDLFQLVVCFSFRPRQLISKLPDL